MTQHTTTPLEIYKNLNKSNCGDCQVKTCFAFASLVCQGQKRLTDCPHLKPEDLKDTDNGIIQKNSIEEEQEASFRALQKKITEIDLETVASGLGGRMKGGSLEIKCLGKNFSINRKGVVQSEIHLHAWVVVPLLNYIVQNSTTGPTGRWVLFKELPNGGRWHPLYMQRCEKPLLKVAVKNEELFLKVLTLFGTQVEVEGVTADIITRHYPLPKCPMLICYTRQDEGFDPSLVFYYDTKTEEIINIESVYFLAVGMAVMIEKIMSRHG